MVKRKTKRSGQSNRKGAWNPIKWLKGKIRNIRKMWSFKPLDDNNPGWTGQEKSTFASMKLYNQNLEEKKSKG